MARRLRSDCTDPVCALVSALCGWVDASVVRAVQVRKAGIAPADLVAVDPSAAISDERLAHHLRRLLRRTAAAWRAHWDWLSHGADGLAVNRFVSSLQTRKRRIFRGNHRARIEQMSSPGRHRRAVTRVDAG